MAYDQTTGCSTWFVAGIFGQYLSKYHRDRHQTDINVHELKIPFKLRWFGLLTNDSVESLLHLPLKIFSATEDNDDNDAPH